MNTLLENKRAEFESNFVSDETGVPRFEDTSTFLGFPSKEEREEKKQARKDKRADRQNVRKDRRESKTDSRNADSTLTRAQAEVLLRPEAEGMGTGTLIAIIGGSLLLVGIVGFVIFKARNKK
jgi:hypothetical protein